MAETAANGIKVFNPFAISDEKQRAWSSSTVMEVNGNSESYARSKFVFAKSAIFAQVCYSFRKLGGAIKYGNKSTL